MKYEVMLILDSDEDPHTILSEIVSNLESVDVVVDAGCVLFDGNEVAVYDSKEKP
jgi:heterodisulfide reductase subunit B